MVFASFEAAEHVTGEVARLGASRAMAVGVDDPLSAGPQVPAGAGRDDRVRREHRRRSCLARDQRAAGSAERPGPAKRVPGYLDARKVEVDIVPAGWKPQVFAKGCPEGTVDRNGYVFCVLDLFHQRLKRLDIFAAASSRWADPRAQLLTQQAWESRA